MPGMERAEPLICPGSPSAKAMVGRCRRSLMRDARIPITPWCQPGWYRVMASGGSPSRARSSSARARRASCCISLSITRRSWLSCCSWVARRMARWGSWLNRHSIPIDMSSRRPAALMRGPTAKPRSAATIAAGRRDATSSRAWIPGRAWPARMRCRPAATRMRLL